MQLGEKPGLRGDWCYFRQGFYLSRAWEPNRLFFESRLKQKRRCRVTHIPAAREKQWGAGTASSSWGGGHEAGLVTYGDWMLFWGVGQGHLSLAAHCLSGSHVKPLSKVREEWFTGIPGLCGPSAVGWAGVVSQEPSWCVLCVLQLRCLQTECWRRGKEPCNQGWQIRASIWFCLEWANGLPRMEGARVTVTSSLYKAAWYHKGVGRLAKLNPSSSLTPRGET